MPLDITKLQDYKIIYESSLTETLKLIGTNKIDEKTNYWKLIKSIKNFDALFGYDGLFEHFVNFFDDNISDDQLAPFHLSIKNIFYRRTFFYLSKFYEDFPPAIKDKNLNFLIKKLDRFRREKTYEIDNEFFFINKIDINNPFSLAPLYETFIDAELFTLLRILQRYCNNHYESQDGLLLDDTIKEKLIIKLSEIVSDFIDTNAVLTHSKKYNSTIKDESNILWGLRTLYDNRKDNFSINNKFSGKLGFEKLVTILASRPINSRRFPTFDELRLEVTPEILNLERTNLFVAFNLSFLLHHKYNFSKEFNSNLEVSIKKILDEYIFDQPINDNLYFKSLRYRCLCIVLNIKSPEKKSIGEFTSSPFGSLSVNG